MSKNDRIEPGSQTPLWDALGSILGPFLVDLGHRFWTKKQLKLYEENCNQKVCESVIQNSSKMIKKIIK